MSDVDDTGFAGMRFRGGWAASAFGDPVYLAGQIQDITFANATVHVEPDDPLAHLCRCGDARGAHISLHFIQNAHDGACSRKRCFCERFEAATP